MKLGDKVHQIKARQILTSRGLPTIEVEFVLENSAIFSSIPSGKSTGKKEAFLLLDRDSGYFGLSVEKVVALINSNAQTMLSIYIQSPEDFDDYLLNLDGTENKSRLGANFILPLSICCYKVFSYDLKMNLWEYLNTFSTQKIHLPIPHFNVLNGGLHSGNGFSCQEIMVCFQESSIKRNLELAVIFYYSLKEVIAETYGAIFTSTGDEGGFAPPIEKLEDACRLVIKSANRASIKSFKIAIDAAANTFDFGDKHHGKECPRYNFDGEKLSGHQLADHYKLLIDEYPIYMIEDPFGETDYESWEYFFQLVSSKTLIVADDLTVTNPKLISTLGKRKMFNTVLIKPNQIGSMSETIKAIETAHGIGMKTMVSHRSAETEDTIISHIAVGMGASFIKAGAPCRGERINKYNELLRIEEAITDEPRKEKVGH
ncbi:phosphopyruvate hydratase [Glugoides intestinalis]